MAELTDQQKKALELDKHISVTANAGSGKTRVLVERYVEAIKSGVDVEQILCLTFTEKAALELREKITERIKLELSAAGKNNKNSNQFIALKEARRKMLEANISTIHAFCSQVLREFPIEAEIDANFKVLEDFDAASLKEEACDEAVRESLASERGNHGKVHNFLVGIGYKRTLGILNDLLDSREKIEHIKAAGKQLLLDEEAVRRHWTNLSKAVLKVAKENVRLKKGDLAAEVKTVRDILDENEIELINILDALKILLDRILTEKGTPRKREVAIVDGSAYSWEDALAILETAFKPLKDFTGSRIGNSKEYFGLLKTLLNLYERSAVNYAQKKYSMGALDFDDLQILTMKLLREKETVRSVLTSRFRHIMVDEFQDTNFLQYDIFLSLLNNFASDAKLFVVGDPKQSIYRFRNAQVEVSQKTEDDLSKRQDGTSLSLFESFRMNADIAAFVNEVFAKVLTSSGIFGTVGLSLMNQTEYKALKARRPSGEANPIEIYIAENDQHSESGDEVESNSQGTQLSAGDLQAQFAASRIRQMVDSGEKVKDAKSDEQLRSITYGDIAILLKTRSKLVLLEEALNDRNVPYVVTSGIGFYSAQEIFDLTNYLTFLLDNTSDIGLLTVLRSPLFGISENELYRISLSDGETLFARLLGFSSSPKATDEVRYTVSVLEEEIQLAQRLTIPQLINRILERTGWLGAYRLSPTGSQRIANLRKLLSIAREFEGRGFNNLYDFVERLKYLKDTAREGQAPVEEAVDAVKIMTVHAAKGLEFPVVVVPFCDANARRGRSLIINDQVGILPFISNEVPPEFSLYKRFEDMSEQAETARLFYVACTRAMDKLIITTAPKKSGSTTNINSFTDILTKTFDLSAPPVAGHFGFSGGKVLVHGAVPQVAEKAVKIISKNVNVGEIFLDSIPAYIDGEIYSATLLQTFKLCPTKYFLRYRLGMPTPESNMRIEEYAEYNDAILSTVRGELIHSTLQQVLSVGKTDESAIRDAAERAISSGLDKSVEEGKKQKLLNQIVENAKNAIGTLGKITKLDKVYLEQTITRRFGSDYLTGTLDLLVEDGKGFHVFDYKTNRLDKPAEKIYSDYEIQMKFYVSLCSKLKAEQKEFDVTIIFTREPGKYLTKVYSGSELEKFESELSTMVDRIKKIEPAGGYFPSSDGLPTVSPHCGECEYFIGDAEKECLLKRTISPK